MFRLFSLGLLSLLFVRQALAGGNLAGTWRQETEGLGVSYWELTPKGEHTYAAQEYGLGNVKGTASFKDDHLVIHWENPDNGVKGVFTWHLKGPSGKGRMEQGKNGETKFDKSSVRFIGK
jgi:hypothetical protein